MPRAPFLLPGVGAQGGRVEDLAPAFAPGRAGGLVTASRSIVRAHEQAARQPGRRGARRGRASARRGLGARLRPLGAARRAAILRPRMPASVGRRDGWPARRSSPWPRPATAIAAQRGISDDGDEPSRSTTPAARSKTTTADDHADAKPTARTYVVRSGRHALGDSLETGVSVERLQQLNPDVDVQALQPGQRSSCAP